MAEDLRWSCSKVSRAENGRCLLTPTDTSAWLVYCAAEQAQFRRLMELADLAWEERAADRNRSVHQRQQS
ncbi:hypothetical protein [Cryptosporangium sp. NPDC048952]|uniref:hypothetical protein n=1 Tax=Cryptosporangium sp. NPDC048952 TaxID=3363961 RepID=UPI00372471CF